MTAERRQPTPEPEPKLKLKLKPMLDTEAKFAAAFTEWERRYREEPDRFMSEAWKLLRETPETYGDACAPYFLQILRELP